jgi:hypothetical protein
MTRMLFSHCAHGHLPRFPASTLPRLSPSLSLLSQCFGWMAAQLQSAADRLCGGRIIFAHEVPKAPI